MVRGLFALVLFQLAGEVFAKALHLPVPGPVLGMIGLIAAVLAIQALGRARRIVEPASALSRAADGLLASLGLLFVPAGVGVMEQGQLIYSRGPALLVVLVISTILTLMVTVAAFLAVSRLLSRTGRG